MTHRIRDKRAWAVVGALLGVYVFLGWTAVAVAVMGLAVLAVIADALSFSPRHPRVRCPYCYARFRRRVGVCPRCGRPV